MPTPPRRRFFVAGLAFLIAGGLAVTSASAVTSQKKVTGPLITGTVKSPGYRLAAVGFNGKSSFSKGQSFKFRAPQSQYTLQLLAAHGIYAGPVVVGGSKTEVIVGAQGSVKLDTVSVVASKGYGDISRRLPASSLVATRWAIAKKGVPIGNGRNLGLVVSKVHGGGKWPGQDEAHVGIPNELNTAVPGKKELRALAGRVITKSEVAAKLSANAVVETIYPDSRQPRRPRSLRT